MNPASTHKNALTSSRSVNKSTVEELVHSSGEPLPVYYDFFYSILDQAKILCSHFHRTTISVDDIEQAISLISSRKPTCSILWLAGDDETDSSESYVPSTSEESSSANSDASLFGDSTDSSSGNEQSEGSADIVGTNAAINRTSTEKRWSHEFFGSLKNFLAGYSIAYEAANCLEAYLEDQYLLLQQGSFCSSMLRQLFETEGASQQLISLLAASAQTPNKGSGAASPNLSIANMWTPDLAAELYSFCETPPNGAYKPSPILQSAMAKPSGTRFQLTTENSRAIEDQYPGLIESLETSKIVQLESFINYLMKQIKDYQDWATNLKIELNNVQRQADAEPLSSVKEIVNSSIKDIVDRSDPSLDISESTSIADTITESHHPTTYSPPPVPPSTPESNRSAQKPPAKPKRKPPPIFDMQTRHKRRTTI